MPVFQVYIPDNTQEVQEINRLMRDATIEKCAKIAAGHNGVSPKDARDIAAKIRALLSPQ